MRERDEIDISRDGCVERRRGPRSTKGAGRVFVVVDQLELNASAVRLSRTNIDGVNCPLGVSHWTL